MSRPFNSADLAQRARLFTPGPRLGWVFRDRWQFLRTFTEPAPESPEEPRQLRQEQRRAERRHHQLKRRTLSLCVPLLVISGILAAGTAQVIPHGIESIAFKIFALIGGAVLMLAIGTIVISRWIRSSATKAITRSVHETKQHHQQKLRDWQSRKAAHEQLAHNYVAQLPEWGAVWTQTATHRLDIFGGSRYTWEAFVTGYGASVLAERPLIVLDLSQERVESELAATAQAAGVPVDVQVLPDQLGESTLLTGLSAAQLTHTLVESMYGSATGDTTKDRAQDERILTELCRALGGNLSLGRVVSGLRAMMNQPDTTDYLTTPERNYIAGELFSTRYLEQSHEALRRMEAHITPLQHLGIARTEDELGYLTCLSLAHNGITVGGDLLKDLIVQWLTHRITTGYEITPEVIIIGADNIALRHLERLANTCRSNNVRLTILFAHLRGVATEFVGNGTVGFMKMSNHKEAKEAAEHIGREHKFVLSQLTANLGGNDTHTRTETDGDSETTNIGTSSSVGWTKNWSKSTAKNRRKNRIFDPKKTVTGTKSTSKTGSDSTSNTRGRAQTRNWSTSRARAEGTNWTKGHTQQRVHEYTVEPENLQHLPDYAMLLLQFQPGRGRVLIPVEIDPAIITLPGVSTEPFPQDLPAFGVSRPALPPAQPTLPPARANPVHQLFRHHHLINPVIRQHQGPPPGSSSVPHSPGSANRFAYRPTNQNCRSGLCQQKAGCECAR